MTTEAIKEGLDKVGEIALKEQERLAKIDAYKKAEADRIAAEKNPQEKKPVVESPEDTAARQAKEAAEKEAKENEALLAAEDESLDEAQRLKKAELIEAKEDESLSAETKKQIERIKVKTQKRIDELIKKQEEAEKKIAFLEAQQLKEDKEKEEAELKVEPDTVRAQLEEKWLKIQEVDLSKPFKDRNEMSDEDLEQFYLEDPIKATQWISRRDLRRIKEEQEELRKAEESAEQSKHAKAILESRKKLVARFPGIDQTVRGHQLKSQGYNDKEIVDTLRSESKEYSLMMDIISEDQEKYMVENGPELVMQEMEKRLKENPIKPPSKKLFTEEEVNERIRMEQERLAKLDQGLGGGIHKQTNSKNSSIKNSTPNYDKGLETFLMAGKMRNKNWTEQDYIEQLEYSQKNRGVKGYEKDT